MDRDFLLDLFAEFGPVTIRRMFSGFGISVDGVNFAMALRGSIYLRADDRTIPAFEKEAVGPFQYQAGGKTVIVKTYWQLPERLYDDPDELGEWARDALAAAKVAAASKRVRKTSGVKRRTSVAKRPVARKAKPRTRQAT